MLLYAYICMCVYACKYKIRLYVYLLYISPTPPIQPPTHPSLIILTLLSILPTLPGARGDHRYPRLLQARRPGSMSNAWDQSACFRSEKCTTKTLFNIIDWIFDSSISIRGGCWKVEEGWVRGGWSKVTVGVLRRGGLGVMVWGRDEVVYIVNIM